MEPGDSHGQGREAEMAGVFVPVPLSLDSCPLANSAGTVQPWSFSGSSSEVPSPPGHVPRVWPVEILLVRVLALVPAGSFTNFYVLVLSIRPSVHPSVCPSMHMPFLIQT